mgnify:CR=1 FL=1
MGDQGEKNGEVEIKISDLTRINSAASAIIDKVATVDIEKNRHENEQDAKDRELERSFAERIFATALGSAIIFGTIALYFLVFHRLLFSNPIDQQQEYFAHLVVQTLLGVIIGSALKRK